jgi:hypothetical protein
MTPTHRSRTLNDQAGMIGKIALLWIVGLLLVGLLILDGLSIVLTTLKLSNTAQAAATTAATTYKNTHDVVKACEAAQPDLLRDNQPVPENDTWCRINEDSGVAAISLRATASSLALGRLSVTQDLTRIAVKETAEPSSL